MMYLGLYLLVGFVLAVLWTVYRRRSVNAAEQSVEFVLWLTSWPLLSLMAVADLATMVIRRVMR